MAFLTGSVVVPATGLVTASSCEVSALMIEDFPAFRGPKRPMTRRSPEGVSFMLIMYFCRHP